MKNLMTLMVIALSSISSVVMGQANDKTSILNASVPVTWLGLDYSGAKFIGDRERFGSQSDVRHLIDAWNDILEKENSKYNPGSAIGRPLLKLATDVTKEHNANLELVDLFSDKKEDYQHLTAGDIDQIIESYDFKGNSGTGLIYVVDSYSKFEEKAAIWVTFVDMGSNKVIYTERMNGQAGGFGMRNYWARSTVEVNENLKRMFAKWKKDSKR
jgi:hypothetical protein